MTSVVWVSLFPNWKIEDVQAGLQVLIAILCTGGAFAFTQLIWQSSGILLQRHRDVALSSLLSISTIGEVWNIVSVLRTRILSKRHWKLVAQAAIVVTLTVATIVSGPIAKASTRTAPGLNVHEVSGFLATTNFSSRYEAVLDLTDTIRELNRAQFPYDQLLDFIPEMNSSWVYVSHDWNSTWSMSCQTTEDTPLTLVDTGVCNNISVEAPATNAFFSYDDYDSWYFSSYTLRKNTSYIRDALSFFVGWEYGTTRIPFSHVANMTIDIAAMHIRGLPRKSELEPKCTFGSGTASSASYTKVRCTLKRKTLIPDELHRAYPDCNDWYALPEALRSYYIDRMNKESLQGLPITTVTPIELIRFYQAYVITKDYQYPHRVSRPLTTIISVVQVSSTFVAFASMFALMVISGFGKYCWFRYRRRELFQAIPESKLDWLIRWTLDEAGLQTSQNHDYTRKDVRLMLPETVTYSSAQMRSIFEGTTCGQKRSNDRFKNSNKAAASSYIQQAEATDPALSHVLTPYAHKLSGSSSSSPWIDNSGYDITERPNHSMDMYDYSYPHTMQQPEPDQSYQMYNYHHSFGSNRKKGYERLD